MIVVTPFEPEAGKAWVGDWWGSSAVAIGRRWIICSFHQDVQASIDPTQFPNPATQDRFILDGVTYLPRKRWRPNQYDLQIIELDEDLPGWHRMSWDPVPVGADVLMAGVGRHATNVPGSISTASPDFLGWGLHWATNKVSDVGGDGRGLVCNFDSPGSGAPATEGLTAKNDSGGGIFVVEEGSGDYLYVGMVSRGAGNDDTALDAPGNPYNYVQAAGPTEFYAGGGGSLVVFRPWIEHVLRPRLSVRVGGESKLLNMRADRTGSPA